MRTQGSACSSFRDAISTHTYALECASSLRRKINREDRSCDLVVIPLRLPFFRPDLRMTVLVVLSA